MWLKNNAINHHFFDDFIPPIYVKLWDGLFLFQHYTDYNELNKQKVLNGLFSMIILNGFNGFRLSWILGEPMWAVSKATPPLSIASLGHPDHTLIAHTADAALSDLMATSHGIMYICTYMYTLYVWICIYNIIHVYMYVCM